MNKIFKKDRKFKEMYVGGRWWPVEASFNDSNPSDDSIWAIVPDAGVKDVEHAIKSAHHAFESWSNLKFNERAHFMIKIAEVMEAKKMDIVKALQGEGGSWFGKGMFEASYLPEIFFAAAAETYQPVGNVIPSDSGKFSMSIRRPLGVISVISPWNFPGILTARGMAFAIAAGNTIVLKPSEESPYCGGLMWAEIFEEAGVPGGVLNVVTCSRENVSEVGAELVENPLVKGISFTGSTGVGRDIAARSGANLKKCCVELGGKDALIVCDDADLDRATGAANFGSFMHQGQICMSVEKVLVQEGILSEFLTRFKERASKLKVGDPTKEMDHIIGPLINDRQVERVQSQLQDAIKKGAKIELGGNIEGRFVEPTIVTNVTSDMALYQDETFGPLAPLFKFETEDEVIEMANDTIFGLASYFYAKDLSRVYKVAEALEYGIVGINTGIISTEMAPFGGVKQSGLGREGSHHGIEDYLEMKYLCMSV